MTKFLFKPNFCMDVFGRNASYAPPDADCGDSWARRAARTFRRSRSIPVVTGCAPPSTRRVIRKISSNVVMDLWRSSSVAPSALASTPANHTVKKLTATFLDARRAAAVDS